jgi:hypothetical protein
MSEPVVLSDYMRGLLVKEICRHIDIIGYCRYVLHISLTKNIRDTFTGDCPYCEGHESFVINEVTGRIYCMACRKEDDFLGLAQMDYGSNLTSTLNMLTGYAEGADERRRKAYAAYAGGGI